MNRYDHMARRLWAQWGHWVETYADLLPGLQSQNSKALFRQAEAAGSGEVLVPKLDKNKNPIRLSAVGRSSDGITYSDPTADSVDKYAQRWEDQLLCQKVFESLDWLQRNLLCWRYVVARAVDEEGRKRTLTFARIAEQMEISKPLALKLHHVSCKRLALEVLAREEGAMNGYDLHAHIRVLLKERFRKEDERFQILN